MMQPDRLASGGRPAEANITGVRDFICNLERHLDDPLSGAIKNETRLRDLPHWNSLQALIVVASFNWDYGVTISADEFAEAETVQDLYALVTQKMRE